MKYLWTTVFVKDMSASLTFYTEIIELQILQQFPAGPGKEIAFLGNTSDNETLVELYADSSKDNIHFTDSIALGFNVDSLESMTTKLLEKNIAISEGPFETPSFKFLTIQDPNGLNVQFFEKK